MFNWRKRAQPRAEEEIQRTITFDVDDDIFTRARKMLLFTGMVNPDRHGLTGALAEAMAMYQRLDAAKAAHLEAGK